jgi:nucleoside-diphosphate-sugar epimerase
MFLKRCSTVSERVIVTGATGFIGASVVAALLAEGRSVTALVRSESNVGRLESLSGLHRVCYDWDDDQRVLSILREHKPATVIHCAWRGVGGRERNEEFQLRDNMSLTLRSVSLASAVGCRQWIGLGSQAEYGNQNKRLSETAPLQPTTRYGEAKKLAGMEALDRCRSNGIAGAWLRVFSTYGPDDSPEWFIPYVIRELLAGRAPKLTLCEQMWDYLYVDDAARAIAAVADGATAGVFNLGSGSARPLRDYVEAAREEIGTDVSPLYGAVPYRPDQVMHLEADISRLVAATTWKPRIDITEGMRETVSFERERALSSLPN